MSSNNCIKTCTRIISTQWGYAVLQDAAEIQERAKMSALKTILQESRSASNAALDLSLRRTVILDKRQQLIVSLIQQKVPHAEIAAQIAAYDKFSILPTE